MDYFTTARINMVKNQLLTHHVHNEAILEIMGQVPRHMFLEGKWQNIAYYDGKIPLENNRFLLPPNLFGRMVESLNLTGDEKILDIGCGSGYSTVVLSHLGKSVVGVESNSSLAVKAASNVSFFKLDNVAIKQAELMSGASENAPYDAIIVNGALNSVPKSLLSQLRQGGRLVTVLNYPSGLSKVVLYHHYGDIYDHIELFDGYADLIV